MICSVIQQDITIIDPTEFDPTEYPIRISHNDQQPLSSLDHTFTQSLKELINNN